ncbi:MAG: CrcB family protein [Acidimicrobiales bacterium]|nr:CrcB family protein [Acidimicrobiales bacterium]
MDLLLAVFVAAGFGAVTRYLVDGVVMRRVATALPVGTMAINITGTFLLGLLTGWATAQATGAAEDWATVVGTGFIGAYGAFSSEEWQSLTLLHKGISLEAINMFGSLAASLLVAWLGLYLGSLT